MSDERRKHPRVKRRMEVTYEIKAGQNHAASESAENISVGGICIFLNEPLESGTRLTVRMSLATSPNIRYEAPAKVAWRVPEPDRDGKYLAGLSFTEVNEDVRRMIEALSS